MTIGSNGTYSSSKNKKKRKNPEATREIVNNLLILMLFSIPVAFIFTASVMRVRLTSETQNMNKMANNMRIEMHNFDREIANYNINIEKSCGKNILEKVKQMKLDLEYPRPGQVKQLKFPREPELQAVGMKSKKESGQL